MKKLYPKNKGKVYPSPSSSSSSSLKPDSVLDILSFLPAAILTLAAILSSEDREVLAYLITRSLKTTELIEEKKKCKKMNSTPNFECGCFECYTGYWFRWDSSPNRELIHQVIEAFEDHLTHGEKSKKGNNKGRKKDKVFKRENENKQIVVVQETEAPAVVEEKNMVVMSEKFEGLEEVEVVAVTVSEQQQQQQRGIARKVLPDVMGLFNSRLWNLWSTNI